MMEFMKIRMIFLYIITVLIFLFSCTPREDNRTAIIDTSQTVSDVHEDFDPESAVPVKIATFNVRRFFDTVCDSGNCDPGDYEDQLSEEFFNVRTEQIANGIRLLDSNIILLQEIENQVCLDSLINELGEENYPVSVMGEIGYPASVDVAVISDGKYLAAIKHRHNRFEHPDGGTTSFAREFLEVHIEYEGRRVIVFTAHFRSKVQDDPGRRLA